MRSKRARLGFGATVLVLTVVGISVGCGYGGEPQDAPVSASIEELVAEAGRIDGLLALVVVRNGESLIAETFDGAEPDDLLHLRSATKSVVSLLIGIALDRGYLTSLDQTLGELLGDRVARFEVEKQALTVRHLLTMSAGLRWDEGQDVEEFNRLVRASDPVAHYLHRPQIQPPGHHWAYSSGASHLLSVILETVTGTPGSLFAERHLFGPLGIDSYRWPTLRDGVTNGAAGLELRSADAARLGELMLARGVWKGRRVVSAEWIERATTPVLPVEEGLEYGLHWFVATEPVRAWLARGYAGQMIAAVPAADLVVVTSCRWRGLKRSPGEQSVEVVRFVRNRLGPSVAPELFK